MKKWNVGAYIRLSREDLNKEISNSVLNQKELLKQFIDKDKELILKDYYIDDGITGTEFNRPEFQRLINDIKYGNINAILIKDLSRFGRNYNGTGEYLEELMKINNFRFISILDHIDSYKDPESFQTIIVPIKNLMNDEYARDISNKTKSALNTKKYDGKFCGALPPYGYKKDSNDYNHLIIDSESSEIVKKIYKMTLNGFSRKYIVNELNNLGILSPKTYLYKNILKKKIFQEYKWNVKSVERILRNEYYLGTTIQCKHKKISYKIHKTISNNKEDWIICNDTHEPIIDKVTWNKVQDFIINRDFRTSKNGKLNLFSGYLKCNDCHNSMGLAKSKYYYCQSYVMSRGKKCNKHMIRKDILEYIVFEIIKTQISLFDYIDELIVQIENNYNISYGKEIIKNKVIELDKEIQKLILLKSELEKDHNNEIVDDESYNSYLNEYEIKLIKLEQFEKELKEKSKKESYKAEQKREWIQQFKKYKKIQTLTRNIITELVENIYICDNGYVKIIFKYEDCYKEAIEFIKNKNVMI